MTAIVEARAQREKRKVAVMNGEISDVYMSGFPAAVPAWGEAERNRPSAFPADVSPTGELLASLPVWGDAAEYNQAIHIHQREANEIHLIDVLEEAADHGGIIMWKGTLPPNLKSEHHLLWLFCKRMTETWGRPPPYIEVDYGWYIFAIKPVWELTA